MFEDQALDLGHTDDRSGYNGIEHAACNRSAGGAKGRWNKRAKRTDVPFIGRW